MLYLRVDINDARDREVIHDDVSFSPVIHPPFDTEHL